MKIQINLITKKRQSFDLFSNQIMDTQQLDFIKGGEDLDGDGIDDETNGVIGTEDVVGF